jgi:hypothetical protein
MESGVVKNSGYFGDWYCWNWQCDELYLIVHGSKLLGQPKSYITDLQVNLYDKESAVPLAKEFHTAFNLDAIDYQTANSQFETGSTCKVLFLMQWVSFCLLLLVLEFTTYEYDDLWENG